MTEGYSGELSRRERQIMEVLYRRGEASVAEVKNDLPDPPSYSAVRATLRVLEEKGHVKHRRGGRKYLFSPRLRREKARRLALGNLLNTFFDDSVGEVVSSLLDLKQDELSSEELQELLDLIERARKEER